MIELPTDLLQFLRNEEQRSIDTSLNELRAIALDFYHGRPFGDEVEGRSQLVTRDVAEVVDAMTVAIMRTVIADKVVEFEAKRSDEPEPIVIERTGDDKADASAQQQAQKEAEARATKAAQDRAEDATETVAYQFMRAQQGYRIVHDGLKAGLLEKTGVFKTWVEQTWRIADGQALASEVDADETIIASEGLPDQYEPTENGMEQIYSVRRRTPGKPKFRAEAVPNEEIRWSPEARTFDEARYIQHRTRHSLATIARDYEVADADAVALWDDATDGQTLSDRRDEARGKKDGDQSAGWGMNRLIWLCEEYVLWDWNGDGVEERLRIHRVGEKVLAAAEVEDQPFVVWTPFPLAHRIVGESLADKTMDIQRVRSVLLRQAMDALYFANAPRVAIDMSNPDDNTLDDVLSIVPGAPIRYRGTPPTALQMPFAAPHAFTALEFMTGERESRTGITRHNQGINADSLNMTATGYKMQADAGAQWEEYIARNFAEALAQLFEKMLRNMKRAGAVEQLRIGGEFKTVDASEFDDDMGIGVRVGLGTGRKDARVQHRINILEMQREAKSVGSPLVDDDKLYNSLRGYVADSIGGDVNMFFNDPAQMEDLQEAPKIDPAALEQQGKLQLAKEQQDGNMALARAKASLDAELARDRASFEADLAERKFQFEQDLAERKMLAELAFRQEHNASVPKNRPGGALDA